MATPDSHIALTPFPTTDPSTISAMTHEDALSLADSLVGLLMDTEQDHIIVTTAPILWNVGRALADAADEPTRTLGLAFQLQAILATPDALTTAVRHLHAYLSTVAPKVVTP